MAEAITEKSQSEILRDLVVDLAVEFVNAKGGMSQCDLIAIFGRADKQSVTYSLFRTPTKISRCRTWEESGVLPESVSGSEATPPTLQKKREALVAQVVDLVKKFLHREEGISQYELNGVFSEGMVADALGRIPLNFYQR